jgi:GNAT superfamily N-acetyltransferase
VTGIRVAGPGDAATMASLRYAFRVELAEPTEAEPAYVARAGGWLASRLASGSWRGWLATEDEVVGLVLAYLLEKVPNPVDEPEAIGYISSLYVRPRYRGRGIGGVLLETAVEACRQWQAGSVVLWPSPRSVPLYRRHGFRSEADVMELALTVK